MTVEAFNVAETYRTPVVLLCSTRCWGICARSLVVPGKR